MNIAEILRQQAQLRPDAPAIIDGRGRRRVTSFAELDRASARAARFLRDNGLRAGDAVLVLVPMSQELYVALIALFRLGCIATFLDPSAGRKHIEACCDLAMPRAFIGSSKAHLLRLISPALRKIPLQIGVGWPVPGAASWRRCADCALSEEIVPCDEQTAALLTFTSGSTGEPKAALRTHGFLLAQHRALSQTLQLRPATLDVTTLPIFLLSNLASGVTSLIPDTDLRRPAAIDAAAVWAQMLRENPRTLGASPALIERLAEFGATQPQNVASLEQVFTGGAPVFPRVLEQTQTMAPDARITAVYGSTEAEPIAHIARDEIGADDLRSTQNGGGLLAGAPVECIHLRILPDNWGQKIGPFSAADFAEQVLSAGEIGEIVVSGAHVLPGYWRGRGDEETKFEVEGTRWHRTGDAGYLDTRGRLWLMGRCAARIVDELGILYPFAVECAALNEPNVRRAALIRHEGQRVLVVEWRERQSAARSAELCASLQKSLAWAHIARVQVLARIPVDKRHNAKIDYPQLERLMKR